METTLHQQLKTLYSSDESAREVTVDGYRIDAVVDDQLIEVQCASLSAIRDKIRDLCQSYDVLVVKPLAASKLLIKRDRKRGRIVSRRRSPAHDTFYNVFEELVHFTNVFPHPRLTLEILLTEQEEDRIPPLKRRWTRKKYRVEDRRLVGLVERKTLHNVGDLLTFVPDSTPATFTTADLAAAAEIPRWLAQKCAYCLRHAEAILPIGKKGNAILYERANLKKVKRRRRRAA